MKNLFNNLSESEKNRILEMHKSATSKQYLGEQSPLISKNLEGQLKSVSSSGGKTTGSGGNLKTSENPSSQAPITSMKFSGRTDEGTEVYELKSLKPVYQGRYCIFNGTKRGFNETNSPYNSILYFDCINQTLEIERIIGGRKRQDLYVSDETRNKFKTLCNCDEISQNKTTTDTGSNPSA